LRTYPVNHLPDIRAIKAILPLKPVFVDLLERFKMIFNAVVTMEISFDNGI
jgi:hypothetical protein